MCKSNFDKIVKENGYINSRICLVLHPFDPRDNRKKEFMLIFFRYPVDQTDVTLDKFVHVSVLSLYFVKNLTRTLPGL